jgi:hypothetical protein
VANVQNMTLSKRASGRRSGNELDNRRKGVSVNAFICEADVHKAQVMDNIHWFSNLYAATQEQAIEIR